MMLVAKATQLASQFSLSHLVTHSSQSYPLRFSRNSQPLRHGRRFLPQETMWKPIRMLREAIRTCQVQRRLLA